MSNSATPWPVAYQAPLSMGFSRQEYWSGLPRPASGDLPNPGIEPRSPVAPPLQADSLPLSHQEFMCSFDTMYKVNAVIRYSPRLWLEPVEKLSVSALLKVEPQNLINSHSFIQGAYCQINKFKSLFPMIIELVCLRLEKSSVICSILS